MDPAFARLRCQEIVTTARAVSDHLLHVDVARHSRGVDAVGADALKTAGGLVCSACDLLRIAAMTLDEHTDKLLLSGEHEDD